MGGGSRVYMPQKARKLRKIKVSEAWLPPPFGGVLVRFDYRVKQTTDWTSWWFLFRHTGGIEGRLVSSTRDSSVVGVARDVSWSFISLMPKLSWL